MRTPLLGAATVAVLAAGALATTGVLGSSHREAPRIMLDPTADNTDVYAFTAPDAPGKLTLVGNWIPFEDPAGGPNFYSSIREARYYVNIDNTGDGVRRPLPVQVQDQGPQPQLVPVRGAGGELDRRSEAQLRARRYAVCRERYEHGHLVTAKLIATACRPRPTTSGPRRFPNYAAVANQAISALPGGGKVFAGQVDDPFFVDLGSTFDAINIDMPGRPAIGTGNQGGGKDDLAGYNVHTIVLQVPKADVTRDGKTPADAKALQRGRRRVGLDDRRCAGHPPSPVASGPPRASERGQRAPTTR